MAASTHQRRRDHAQNLIRASREALDSGRSQAQDQACHINRLQVLLSAGLGLGPDAEHNSMLDQDVASHVPNMRPAGVLP